MGGGGQTSTQTTQVNLSPEQQSLLNMAMPFATQFAQNQPQLPSGSSVAPFNPNQTSGQQQVLNAAGSGVSQSANNAGNAQSFLTTGAALNPASNPGLSAAIQGAELPIEQNFSENIEPAIREGGVGVGQFGGGREGALEGIATQAEQQAIGATAGQMENQNYQNALDQMTKAMGLTPTVQQAQLEPGTATSSVGDVQQQLTQEQLTEAFNRFMFPQEQPLSTAESLASIASGIPGGGSTTTGQVNSSLSPFSTAVGLGSLGASLFGGNGMFGNSGAFGPSGMFSSFLPALLAA
jgi:hypothetical protein